MTNMTNEKTVYFDDFGIKAVYNTAKAYQFFTQSKTKVYDVNSGMVIKMPLNGLTSSDLNIQIKNHQLIITPKHMPKAFNIKKVIKLPKEMHFLDMNTEYVNQMLVITIPKIDLKFHLN